MTLPLQDYTLQDALNALETLRDRPYGPELGVDNVGALQGVGDACIKLCGGDKDKARTLWKLVVEDHFGYFPVAAGKALIRASMIENIVPDVTAPDPT